jgi:hypothetical protein
MMKYEALSLIWPLFIYHHRGVFFSMKGTPDYCHYGLYKVQFNSSMYVSKLIFKLHSGWSSLLLIIISSIKFDTQKSDWLQFPCSIPTEILSISHRSSIKIIIQTPTLIDVFLTSNPQRTHLKEKSLPERHSNQMENHKWLF